MTTAKATLARPGEPEVLLHMENQCFVSYSISSACKNKLLTVLPVSTHVLGCEVPTFQMVPAASQGTFSQG